MDQFNLGNPVNRFINNPPNGRPMLNPNQNLPTAPEDTMQLGQNILNQRNSLLNKFEQYNNEHSLGNLILNNLRMNSLESMERSLYVKNLMQFPKEMDEILQQIQTKPQNTPAVAATQQEVAAELLESDVSIATLADLIQKGGKDAVGKLITAMAEASRQGVQDTSQLKDAIKLINASISVATNQQDSTQVLKTFMLLYLPWLPLQQGVDFELELEELGSNGGEKDDETVLNIIITTKNYGVLKVTLILTGVKTIDFVVNCSEKFPKEELLKRLKSEIKKHSIESTITFAQSEIKPDEDDFHKAKISMSSASSVNPFLLLMANSVIRHVIDLDNNA